MKMPEDSLRELVAELSATNVSANDVDTGVWTREAMPDPVSAERWLTEACPAAVREVLWSLDSTRQLLTEVQAETLSERMKSKQLVFLLKKKERICKMLESMLDRVCHSTRATTATVGMQLCHYRVPLSWLPDDLSYDSLFVAYLESVLTSALDGGRRVNGTLSSCMPPDDVLNVSLFAVTAVDGSIRIDVYYDRGLMIIASLNVGK